MTGFGGKYLVNSFDNGDGATGTLTSPRFTIRYPYINFRIGGGNFHRKTCLNLRIGREVVRTAAGNKTERLEWKSWDVSALKGKRAFLQIVDQETQPGGHILVDDIEFADRAR